MASSPDQSQSAEQSDRPPDDAWVDEVRWPLLARIGVAFAVLAVVGAIAASLVAAFVVDRGDDGPALDDVVDPVAPVAFGADGFVFGERTTGRIIAVDETGATSVLATVPDELRIDGQRGLLGLAVREGSRPSADAVVEVFATWTRADDDRLVVGRILPGPPEIIWAGPVTSDLANGGTLAWRNDALLVGVGELQDPGAVADPTTPNGKILALDPAGPSDQTPTVVAGGWHNPFALTVADGVVWLVDNASGANPERLVRVDADGTVTAIDLDGRRAPSGLAVRPDGDLVLCGFVSMVVERIPTPTAGVEPPVPLDGPPCATGVAVTGGGDVVTATADAIVRARPGS